MRLLGDIDRLDRPAWLLLVISGLYAVSHRAVQYFCQCLSVETEGGFRGHRLLQPGQLLAMAVTFVLAIVWPNKWTG